MLLAKKCCLSPRQLSLNSYPQVIWEVMTFIHVFAIFFLRGRSYRCITKLQDGEISIAEVNSTLRIYKSGKLSCFFSFLSKKWLCSWSLPSSRYFLYGKGGDKIYFDKIPPSEFLIDVMRFFAHPEDLAGLSVLFH